MIPLPHDPIDMTGFRTLRVEVCYSGEPKAVRGAAVIQVMESDDGKHWASKGPATVVSAGEFASASFMDTRPLVRLSGEAREGVPAGRVSIRIFREA